MERIFWKALHTLSHKGRVDGQVPYMLQRVLENFERTGEHMSLTVESISSDEGLGQPRRFTIELVDWSAYLRTGPRRPGVYSDRARRDYDYESTAEEELEELPGPRKELPRGE